MSMTEPKNFVCEICNFQTTNKYKLDYHIKSKRHRQIVAKKENTTDSPTQSPIQIQIPSLEEIQEKYKNAINYSQFMRGIEITTYEALTPIIEKELITETNWVSFFAYIYSLFMSVLKSIPDENLPIRTFEKPDSLAQDTWFVKENNIWYELNGVDRTNRSRCTYALTDEVYYIIFKPILAKLKKIWLDHYPNLNTTEEIEKYELCGQILCKYDTIFEYMHPIIPASIKDILIKDI